MPYIHNSGYWPPEYIKHQIVSREFDIFSLGVIIVKIMTGYGGYNSIVEMTTRKFVQLVSISLYICQFQHQQNVMLTSICCITLTLVPIFEVHESWRKRLWETLNQNPIFEVHESWRKRLCETNHISIEVYCNQVKRCIEIALDCLKTNRQERPTINDIISSLNETETIIGERGMQNEQVQPH
jgi:serine/threonine protein kinase